MYVIAFPDRQYTSKFDGKVWVLEFTNTARFKSHEEAAKRLEVIQPTRVTKLYVIEESKLGQPARI